MTEPTTSRESAAINEAELLRRYEEKKRLLGGAGAAQESKPVFREAFREEVAQTIPSVSPAAGSANSDTDASSQRALDRATKEELKALVAMALADGVFRAIQKAIAETPYLIDALHDELADHYYQKLVEAGLIS